MKLIIALVLIGLVSCSNTKEFEIQKVSETIDSVYFQKWVAGIQGGGSGTNFHVNLKTPLEKDLILEKVQFESFEASFVKISETSYIAYIRTNSNQNDLILDENPEKEYGNKVSVENLKPNEANLFFTKNGKEFVKNLQNVKEKPMLAYPSVKPKN
ncbi:hypothetical protein [uncultured Flavobacterium sp.]|uniref:hypothetical protein n=1 Tax=uncultured Flavobacterium sp. TaxID=165435 RepID=UPI0030EE6521|tara:strand:+ start:18975 stop:19442 length:468 start_codon:yes stop_codon:yes gene_type:complete